MYNTYKHTRTRQLPGFTNGLSFEEQYWSLSSTLETAPLIYGLGQQKAPFRLPAGEENGMDIYTLWARDVGSTPDHKPQGGTSLYGSHPFYMQVSKRDGLAHGVYVRSSNAMDVALTQTSITFRGTGGIIDMTVFMGDTPKEVMLVCMYVCVYVYIYIYNYMNVHVYVFCMYLFIPFYRINVNV
jgi:alpha-glucosidase (family GH31 glycosyl hydrolase)